MVRGFWHLAWIGVLGLSACSTVGRAPEGLDRAIWVSRFDWKTAADIDRIFHDCAQAGLRAVFFQVRGNGTVLWDSRHEVWSDQLGFHDPGFDPLATAVAAARSKGLAIHAWFNVMPGWSGETVPPDARQLWNIRPGWFLADERGRRLPLARGVYACLNPCLPEVREYLARLCQELVARYDLDGLHLDYIRFVERELPGGPQLPGDLRSANLFRRATNRDPSDRAAFEVWKTDAVTETVRAIRAAVPSTTLTAAVLADPQLALDESNQDWGRWAREGLVDALVPMNYTADHRTFAERVRLEIAHADGVPVIVGIGTYKHRDPLQTLDQVDLALAAGANGVAYFSYAHVFGEQKSWRDAIATRPKQRQ